MELRYGDYFTEMREFSDTVAIFMFLVARICLMWAKLYTHTESFAFVAMRSMCGHATTDTDPLYYSFNRIFFCHPPLSMFGSLTCLSLLSRLYRRGIHEGSELSEGPTLKPS
jgi:Na+-translocating ferredoxin:NAD+ oxidoreductase RnfD subunit